MGRVRERMESEMSNGKSVCLCGGTLSVAHGAFGSEWRCMRCRVYLSVNNTSPHWCGEEPPAFFSGPPKRGEDEWGDQVAPVAEPAPVGGRRNKWIDLVITGMFGSAMVLFLMHAAREAINVAYAVRYFFKWGW